MKHWYGIVPNGTEDGREVFMLNWYSETPYGTCYVPASADYARGICPRLNALKEELISAAKALSRGRYDIVVYRRKSEEDPWTFVQDEIYRALPDAEEKE